MARAEAGLAKINLHPNDWRHPDNRAQYLDALAPEVVEEAAEVDPAVEPAMPGGVVGALERSVGRADGQRREHRVGSTVGAMTRERSVTPASAASLRATAMAASEKS